MQWMKWFLEEVQELKQKSTKPSAPTENMEKYHGVKNTENMWGAYDENTQEQLDWTEQIEKMQKIPGLEWLHSESHRDDTENVGEQPWLK